MGLTKVHLGLDSVWGREQAELWKEEAPVCETSSGKETERLQSYQEGKVNDQGNFSDQGGV